MKRFLYLLIILLPSITFSLNPCPGIPTVTYAGKLVSGIYFYKMQTGDFVQTKELILQK